MNSSKRKYIHRQFLVTTNFYLISRELNFRFLPPPGGSKLATLGSNLIHKYFLYASLGFKNFQWIAHI